jgi:hypothetical protein
VARAHLTANFQGTGVDEASNSGVAVFFADLTFSEGSSAEKQRIFSAGLEALWREIVRS